MSPPTTILNTRQEGKNVDDEGQILCSELYQIGIFLIKSTSLRFLDIGLYNGPGQTSSCQKVPKITLLPLTPVPFTFQLPKLRGLQNPAEYAYSTSSPVSITKLTCALLI